MSNRTSRIAAVAVGAVVLVGASSIGAVAAKLITSDDIKNQTIQKADIGKDAVGGSEVVNKSLDVRHLSSEAREALKGATGAKGDTGARGPEGARGPQGAPAGLSVNSTSGATPTVVANIGGSFATRATTADTFTLPAGTHQITTDGFFISNAATSGQTRLQVAVRAGTQDLGTCFTGLTSTLANREATCSTTRVVTVTEPTEVTVKVFGYADNQGSADGGLFNAFTATSALKVG